MTKEDLLLLLADCSPQSLVIMEVETVVPGLVKRFVDIVDYKVAYNGETDLIILRALDE